MLTQWAGLRDWLAPSGVALDAVIVADDENLELARAHGFQAIEHPNDRMGAKWNAGFEAASDADYLVLVGSDNWVHPETFAVLDDRPTAASALDYVDLPRGVLQHASAPDLIPWVIPWALLEPLSFRPFTDQMQRGSEAMLRHALGRPALTQRCAPSVNFNTVESVSPYAGVRNSIGDGVELDMLSALAETYPAPLVELARQTMERIA